MPTRTTLVSAAATFTSACVLIVGCSADSAKPANSTPTAPAMNASPDLAQQIADTMAQRQGRQPGFRFVHAKGLVCIGAFTPSPEAASISRAAHFQGNPTNIQFRFSDGAPDPTIPDMSPDAAPRGMAIRFMLPGGKATDIVAMSTNGFVVSTGEEFLALQKSIVATDPSKPHPWPVEEFIGSHSRAMAFVAPKPVPTSFATEAFFSNNAFTFVNKSGQKQAGRYQIVPLAGHQTLDPSMANYQSNDFLFDELKSRLPSAPAQYRLLVQLPNSGDSTSDSSTPWPDDRKTVELGTITVSAVVPDSPAAEKALAFDPAKLTDGIELSDDPLPALRSSVYHIAAKARRESR